MNADDRNSARETAEDESQGSGEFKALSRLLQGALAEAPEPRTQFLPAIQERIRRRTRGRYYREQPRALRDPTLLLLGAACLLLVLAAFLYLTLEPLL